MTYKTYSIILWLLCIIGSFATIPFMNSTALLMGNNTVTLMPLTGIAIAIEAMIVYGLLIFFGMKFAKKINARFIFLDKSYSISDDLLKPGIIAGTLCALAMLITDTLIPTSSFSLWILAKNTPPLVGLLGALFGIVNQEVVVCLIGISGIALLLKRLLKSTSTKNIMWMSILTTSIFFGILHIPTFIQTVIPDMPFLVIRIVLLNIISGTTFGFLFWQKSFETAVFTHMIVDSILYVIVPLISH